MFSSGVAREARRSDALQMLTELSRRAAEVGADSVVNESVPRLQTTVRSARFRWELDLAVDQMRDERDDDYTPGVTARTYTKRL